MLPPLTPYPITRFGKVALTPCRRPGDKRLGDDIADIAGDYRAVLLANHGPIVATEDLESTVCHVVDYGGITCSKSHSNVNSIV